MSAFRQSASYHLELVPALIGSHQTQQPSRLSNNPIKPLLRAMVAIKPLESHWQISQADVRPSIDDLSRRDSGLSLAARAPPHRLR
jgi:hypothetical protein